MKQIKSLSSYYIKHYGKDLENKIDPIDKMEYPIRLFCSDCPNFIQCGGARWKGCPNRDEALIIMYPMYTSDGKIIPSKILG